MLGDWWILLVGALPVLVVVVVAGLRGRARSNEVDALTAEPEDRPLPAVVANPIRIEPGTRRRITEVCTGLGWAEPLWLETTVEDPGTGQAELAVEKGADVVLACGGDGTVRSVAQALAGTGVAMGLVPAGTGNLLARTLGTPENVAAATRIALTGDDRAVDVGRIRVDGAETEHAFLVMAGTGFDAAIMQNTPEALKVRVGPLAYVISGLRTMRGRRTRVTLTLDDGEPLRRRTRTVVVGNSGTLLGGLVLMPNATIDDGVLDVVNIAPKTVAGWVAVAGRVITRRRDGNDRVEHWQARSITIAADAPQPSQLDGDPIGDAQELRIRVDPGALVVRVPDVPPPDAPDPG
ncbi:diacylglycerol/lipid kinase family protein [Pseudonocardia nigra]|uniref:diacylglycerol/lipid kinase family protein n=1 Tax=Pseudonocardia nigra TaxID=1921578 RepID=UPI001C5D40C3|nr:YegS/Rv2252/BmrU family lipid kinase [Pseudonocardia nigra]